MPRPTVRLLGGPTLFDPAGLPIAGGPAQRHRVALLAQLAVAFPGSITRDRLIGLLWPDRGTTAARNLLNVSLAVLRQAFGSELIVTVGDDLRLNAGVIDVDVHDFERALDEARLEDALRVYRGAFLEGFFLDDSVEFERWVESQRIRLARRYVDALSVLAERTETNGELHRAIGWWRALAHAEPTSPEAVLRLFDALVAVGDVTGALAAEETHSAHMRAEVGIEPDPRVLARAQALRISLVRPERAALPRVAPMPPGEPAAPAAVKPRAITRSRLVAAAACIMLGGVGAAWVRSRPPHRAGDPDLIAAIIPVAGRGSGANDELAAEFDDLLALNLDQVDGVRIASAARSTLLRDVGVPPAQVARELHASVAITGRLITDSATMTVTLSLTDSTGQLLGTVSATEPHRADLLSALVDGASVQVMRLLWGRRWLVPEPRIAAISTTSMPALRAFLQGERDFRVSHWDSAGIHYQDAVDLDSTFALAYFRLGEVDGWRARVTATTIAEHLQRALRLIDRLPPREAMLLRYRMLFATYDVRAVAAATELAARYPDDADAQLALADVWWHVGIIAPHSLDSLVMQWHRAIATDPVSVRPILHPIDLAQALHLRSWYDSLVALQAARGGEPLTPRQRAESLALWSPLRVVRDSLLAHAHDMAPRGVHPVSYYAGVALLGRCVAGASCGDTVVTTLTALAHNPEMAGFTLDLDELRGNLRAIGWEMGATPPLDLARRLVTLSGIDPRAGEFAAVVSQRLNRDSDDSWRSRIALAQLALIQRDTLGAHRALETATTILRGDSSTWGPFSGVYSPPLTRAMAGWIRIAAGDTAVGIRLMDSSIQAAGFVSEALQEGQAMSSELAITMAAYAPTRAEGITRLRWITTLSDANKPEMRWYLARALDANGDTAAARSEYRQFATLWRDADPELQGVVTEARRRW
jgi:DNA-binding SARP family transcriptional activator